MCVCVYSRLFIPHPSLALGSSNDITPLPTAKTPTLPLTVTHNNGCVINIAFSCRQCTICYVYFMLLASLLTSTTFHRPSAYEQFVNLRNKHDS